MKNHDFVRALEHAKRNLWNGKGPVKNKSRYICWSLPYDLPEIDMLRDIIESRLNGRKTVGAWLNLVMNIPAKQLTHENIQEYRLRWIDHLIKEFS